MSVCVYDQAIFTSIRTPTGEGYRVIAASPGLRQDEKQAITRLSPSHNGLCHEPPKREDSEYEVTGVAYYCLPTGRCCIAMSGFAGAEHTARGGQRIYTYNLIGDPEHLRDWAYNVFRVVRAAVRLGLPAPQLKPEKVLDEVRLEVDARDTVSHPASIPDAIADGHAAVALRKMLDGEPVVLSQNDRWLETAEAVLLGVPGPVRAGLSFSAGLQFSASRTHTLMILHDGSGRTRNRVAGLAADFVDCHGPARPIPASPWFEFVQRMWTTSLKRLDERTSRPFADPGPSGRSDSGMLYNVIDGTINDLPQLFAAAEEVLDRPTLRADRWLLEEAIETLRRHVLCGLPMNWAEMRQYWDRIARWWCGPGSISGLATPIIERMMQQAMADEPETAEQLLWQVSQRDIQNPSAHRAFGPLAERMLESVAHYWIESEHQDRRYLREVSQRWNPILPGSPGVARLRTMFETIDSAPS